ncbi:MAG: phosphate regulon transcriptional regulator PhoB [Gammaproteobacteria bacterium]|nr:phosphate regulon transcriptional regulator PhoB [Gammaproteobacteria bacterium]
MGKTILIVEDEPSIRTMVGFALSRAGYQISEAANAMQAQSMLEERLPDLILLDWMLPGISGIDFARRLKKDEHTQKVPIIMLTARVEEDDKIRGLEVGADDYVIKPFSPRELEARIKAVMRRAAPQDDGAAVVIDDLRLDPDSHRVTARGEPLSMGPTEFRLLQFFMTNPERVFSRSQLLDRVWGDHAEVEERTVDVHIRRLRKALTPYRYDQLIQTVRGVGYRFSRQV